MSLSPRSILEDEQIARERIALQDRPHHAGERVDPLASVHGLDGDQDAAAGQQAQHAAAPTAATSRVTASGAALNGNRTTIPGGKHDLDHRLGHDPKRARTPTDEDGFRDDSLGSRARIRRQRSKFDRVSFRSRQNALIV